MNPVQVSPLRKIWSNTIETGVDFDSEGFMITKPFAGAGYVGVRASFPSTSGVRDRCIYMFDVGSGQHLWSHLDKSNFLWAADPLIFGDAVYSAESRVLDVIDLATGNERWSAQELSSVRSRPAIGAGLVFIGGSESSDEYKLYAFSIEDGSIAWTVKMEEEPIGEIAFDQQCVYITSGDGIVYCYEAAKGTLRWQTRFAPPGMAASPKLCEGLLFVPDNRGGVGAIDAASGEWRWHVQIYDASLVQDYQDLWIASPLCIADNKLFVCGNTIGKELSVLDVNSGNHLGSVPLPGEGVSSLVAQNGILYGDTEQYPGGMSAIQYSKMLLGDQYISDSTSIVFSVDSRSGKMLWTQPFPRVIIAPLAVNGAWLFLSDKDFDMNLSRLTAYATR